MKEKSTKVKLGERRSEGKTDWDRLRKIKDEDIDFSDIPETDADFWASAELIMPEVKKSVHLRIDPDVLEWFRAQGRGHLTRMNAVLRSYYEAHKKDDARK